MRFLFNQMMPRFSLVLFSGLVLASAGAFAQQQVRPVPVPVQIQAPASPAVAIAPVLAAGQPVTTAPVPAVPLTAAPSSAAPAVPAGTPAPSVEDVAARDAAQRVALAQKLQALMPAGTLLESAIVAQSQSLPDNDRAAFRERVIRAIDPKRLEAVSVKALSDLFTAQEMTVMLAYFGAPEAQAISAKLQTYQNMLQPEIARMLDNALMEVRPEQPQQPVVAPAKPAQ